MSRIFVAIVVFFFQYLSLICFYFRFILWEQDGSSLKICVFFLCLLSVERGLRVVIVIKEFPWKITIYHDKELFNVGASIHCNIHRSYLIAAHRHFRHPATRTLSLLVDSMVVNTDNVEFSRSIVSLMYCVDYYFLLGRLDTKDLHIKTKYHSRTHHNQSQSNKINRILLKYQNKHDHYL